MISYCYVCSTDTTATLRHTYDIIDTSTGTRSIGEQMGEILCIEASKRKHLNRGKKSWTKLAYI